MFKYLTLRLVYLIPVLIGVTLIVFTLLYLTPGDPAKMLLGESASAESLDAMREKLGLNDPYLVQYGNYMKRLVLEGDMGISYVTSRPVMTEILAVFPNTLKLAVTATLFSIFLGILFGIISAIKQNTFVDSIITFFSMIGISMPMFWVGLLLILLFSVRLGWLPSSGLETPQAIILPALALGCQSLAMVARMTRSTMLEVIRQDYIRTARSKGQREIVVILKHALKNALIPIITVVGLQFGEYLGGAILAESIFSIPGVGRLMLESLKARDYTVVQGVVLLIAITFSVVNLVVDMLYFAADPRLRKK